MGCYNRYMRKWTQEQKGLGTILVIVLIMAVAGIGFGAYGVYKQQNQQSTKHSATNTFTGTVISDNCLANKGCPDLRLKQDNGTSYGLTGKNATSYNNQRVKIEGQLNGTPPTQIITVQSITTITTEATTNTPAAKGMVKGQVFCTQKIDPVSCATSLDFELRAGGDPRSGMRGPTLTTETDVNGNFSIALDPGQYDVTPAPKPGYPMFVPPLPNPVTSTAGKTTEIKIYYHDGTK